MTRPRRRVLAAVGAALAVLAGLGVAQPAASLPTYSISGAMSLAEVPLGPDESHEPVDCRVELVPLDGSYPGPQPSWRHCEGYTFTDVAPGEYLVAAYPYAKSGRWAHSWYGGTPYRSQASVVTVGDHSVTGVDIELPLAGFIEGRVSVDGPLPEGGVLVSAHLQDPGTGAFEFVTAASADAATGEYVLGALPGGSYAVQFADAGEPAQYADQYQGGAAAATEADLVEVSAETSAALDGRLSAVWSRGVDRVAGADRFETNVALSGLAFPDRDVPVAFLANGLNWPDALSAGPAAAHLGGPLLLTAPDELPVVVAEELDRLSPEHVIVVGDAHSVSDAVVDALRRSGHTVERVAGPDRYATSRAIMQRAFGASITNRSIYVATGVAYADALSAGRPAIEADAPLLLVNGASPELDAPTREALRPSTFLGMTIVGGTPSIPEPLAHSLQAYTRRDQATRIGGVDRYDTSRRLAEWTSSGWPPHASGAAFLATGEGFADALSATSLAGLRDAPILLTPPTCVQVEAIETMERLRVSRVTLLGGTPTLSERVDRLTRC